MPLEISHDAPTLFVRRESYERVALTRASIDERLGLTADEFRVEGGLVVIGPVFDDEALARMIDEFESLGLRHFDDYFDFSGNWPAWLKLLIAAKV